MPVRARALHAHARTHGPVGAVWHSRAAARVSCCPDGSPPRRRSSAPADGDACSARQPVCGVRRDRQQPGKLTWLFSCSSSASETKSSCVLGSPPAADWKVLRRNEPEVVPIPPKSCDTTLIGSAASEHGALCAELQAGKSRRPYGTATKIDPTALPRSGDGGPGYSQRREEQQ